MQQLQQEIELKFSKKFIKDVIRAEIDPEHKIIQSMCQAIHLYRNKQYSYKSKVIRVATLDKNTDDIAIELAVAVIGLDELVPIQVVVAKLAEFLNYRVLLDGVKTAAEIIAVCESSGLYDLVHSTESDNTTGTLSIKPKYEVSKLVKEFIKQTKYLPPMIVEPVKWSDNKTGGYLMGSGSVVLGTMTHTNEYQALDVLNILQGIEWELNTDMLEFLEVSKKELGTHEKTVNFNRMRDTSEEVYRNLLEQGNKFYFVWKYDFRGRSYSSGYHVNLQGNSYRKSCIQFKKKEILTEDIIL